MLDYFITDQTTICLQTTKQIHTTKANAQWYKPLVFKTSRKIQKLEKYSVQFCVNDIYQNPAF